MMSALKNQAASIKHVTKSILTFLVKKIKPQQCLRWGGTLFILGVHYFPIDLEIIVLMSYKMFLHFEVS
jgi:hypothetical protein